MRKTIVVLIAIAFATTSMAQENSLGEPLYRNTLRMSIDGLFQNRYQLGYERVLGERTSLSFTAGAILYLSKEENENGEFLNEERRTGFLLEPQFRVYFSDFNNTKVPVGFYLGAFANYRQTNELEHREDPYSYFRSEKDEWNAGLGFLVGIQYLSSFGLGFDLYIGPEIRYTGEDVARTFSDQFNPELTTENTSRIVQETVPYAALSISYGF